MDTAQSISFVEKNGTELEVARMRYILYGKKPQPAVIQPFIDLQNSDWGFPFRLVMGNVSSLNSTLVALLWMDELGMMDSPAANNAFKYVIGSQKGDGGWDENVSIARYDPPPWASPGEQFARIYLTAQSTFWLAAGGYSSEAVFQRALDFLLPHQEQSGRFQGFLHTTWIATSVFLMAGAQYSEVVNKGLKALMDIPLSKWVDSQISWALECFGRAGLQKTEPFVELCLSELVRRQKLDGKWVSEDGEARTVGAVISTIKVLKHYGMFA